MYSPHGRAQTPSASTSTAISDNTLPESSRTPLDDATTSSITELDDGADDSTLSTTSIPSSPRSHFSEETLDLPRTGDIPIDLDPETTSLLYEAERNRTPSPPPAYSEDIPADSIWPQPLVSLFTQATPQQDEPTTPSQTLTLRRPDSRPDDQPTYLTQLSSSQSHPTHYGTITQVNNYNYIHAPTHVHSATGALVPQPQPRNQALSDLESHGPYRCAPRVKTSPIALSVANGRALCRCCCCTCTCSRASFAVLLALITLLVILGLNVGAIVGHGHKQRMLPPFDWGWLFAGNGLCRSWRSLCD